MNSFLKEWVEEASEDMNSELVVVSLDHLSGPKRDVAKASVRFIPCPPVEQLVVDVTKCAGVDKGYVRAFVFGIIDVLAARRSRLLYRLTICVESMEAHPAFSSPVAFRKLGRDAATKYLQLNPECSEGLCTA